MAEKVGSIYYEVTADTAQLVVQEREVERSTARMAGSFNAITLAVKGLAAAYAAVKAAQMADDFRLLQVRVDIAAGSIEAGAKAMASLRDISTSTRSALADNVAVFARLNPSITQLGGNASDTLRIVDMLSKAITVSGASAQEKSAAMIQFGQALGSGKLAGDELRSLLENAPYLMKQLADGLGVPIGKLKELGEQGKLTSDVVVNALGKASQSINRDFAQFPQTLSGAFTVAGDALRRLNEKIDAFSNKSAILTGIVSGVSQVLGTLADLFDRAAKSADGLGRNEEISTWGAKTAKALSYVADAADVTWQTLSVLGRNVAFVFEGIGREIGGIGAQVAAVMRGDFAGAKAIGEAMRAESEQARRELDAADARTLADRKTWGAQMRAAWEDAAGNYSNEGRGRMAPGSKLKAPTPEAKKSTFDAAAYLAGLEKEYAEGYDKIDAVEREALRKNAQLLAEGKITRQQAAEAVTLIEANAAKDRHALGEKELEDRIKLAADIAQMEIDAAKKLADERAKGLLAAQDAAVAGDPVAQLQLELQRKQDILTQYALQDLENAKLYADAKVALERETQKKIDEITAKRIADQQAAQSAMLVNYGALFGSMADLLKGFGEKQSGAYRALFAVSKAFAIADSIIKIQTGIANAAALPFPANIGAMASVAAATAGIVATIKGVNYGGGRQYGGPVSSGSLYRINETGRPEMFTAANGSQYMLPTQSGRVTPADQVAGGQAPTVIIQNMGAPVQVQQQTYDRNTNTTTLVIAEVADQIASHRGPVWQAMRSSTNVAPRL